MRTWELLKLALEGIRRTPLRLALTSLGVAIAAGALVAMVAFAEGLHAQVEKPFQELEWMNRIDVFLQRPGARYPPAPVILIGRRVPYERFTPWLTQFAPAAQLEARHEVVFRFFRTSDAEEAMAIARALGAGYVVLYGADRLRFDPTGHLVLIHEEDGARVYRVLG